MAWSASEVQRSGPRYAQSVARVGDLFVAFGGNSGGGGSKGWREAVVWDTSADTVAAYTITTLCNSSYYAPQSYATVTIGSTVWVYTGADQSGYQRQRIGTFIPSTGVDTAKYTAPESVNQSPMVRVGDLLVTDRLRYDHTTDSGIQWSATSGGAALGSLVLGTNGTRLFSIDGGTLREHSTVNGTVTATWALPASTGWHTQRAAQIGTTLWWANNASDQIAGFDCATDTVTVRATTPSGGFGRPTREWVAHTDGLLYAYSGTSLTVVDPATGRWATDTLPTRGERSDLMSTPTGLWAAQGQPLTWPL